MAAAAPEAPSRVLVPASALPLLVTQQLGLQAIGGVRGPGYSGVFAVRAALVVVGLGLLVLERSRSRGRAAGRPS